MLASAARKSPFSRVAKLLGSRLRIQSPIDLHEQIMEGLPRSTAVYLAASLHEIKPDETIRVLNISQRTWHRIKAEKSELAKPLDVDQSSRVWNMAEILATAEDVLGSREEAEQWLTRPAIGLNSRRPIDLMASPQGAELVKTLLTQMEYGVYA